MLARSVHDRDELVTLLRRDAALHAYEIGDLDDRLWPYTTWYRLGDAVAMLFHGAGTPTLLALDASERLPELTAMLQAVAPLLPSRLYAQISVGAEKALDGHFSLRGHGRFLKMTLTDRTRLAAARPLGEPLGRNDLDDLLSFYRRAYPDGWFQPRMLDTGPYFGIRREGTLIAVAGSHIWSPDYRVAALGNVATDPTVRGQGLATAVVARWCLETADTVDHVVLNVKADNAAAVTVYERLGFAPAGLFAEYAATARARRP